MASFKKYDNLTIIKILKIWKLGIRGPYTSIGPNQLYMKCQPNVDRGGKSFGT